MKKTVKISIALVTALFFGGCDALNFGEKNSTNAPQRQMSPSHVDVFVAQKSDVPISFDYTAIVESQQDVMVYPKVSGTLVKQLFKAGDKVKFGDKLFLIDSEKYEASFEAFEAAVGVANANLKNAQTEFNRVSNLYEKNAISKKDYDAAVAAFESAKANLQSAKANSKNAKIDLGYTTITAPFDGILGDNLVDVGSLVMANQTALVRLTKLNPIDAKFQISDVDNLNRNQMEQSSTWVQTNANAVLKINGEEFEGKVKFIDNVVNTNTGSVAARAEFQNQNGKILPGAFGQVKMSGFYQKNAFNIPQVAIQQTAVKTYVLVVKDGKVGQKDVKITYQTKDMAVVSEGLEVGDQIIVNNFLKIRAGAPVVVDKDLSADFGKNSAKTAEQIQEVK